MTTSSVAPPPLRSARRTIVTLAAAVLLWGNLATTGAAESRQKTYALPAADAAVALNKFAEQSGEQVIYLLEQVRGIRTNAVHGRFTAREAIERLIANTILQVVEDRETGALMIQRGATAAPPGGARGARK